jgi:lipopolysaccharide export system permease protein
MRTLHAYLTRQVLATVAMTVLTFTFVLLLGNVLKEILALLLSGQATLGLVVQSILLLVPFVLVYSLPMGMLTATLLVFGRFSADQELTAVRASGVSLLALATPVLLLSVALSGVAAFINLDLAPRCRVAYRTLLQRTGVQRAASLIVEDRFMEDFPGYVVYVNRKRDADLEDVLIYQLNKDNRIEKRLQATRAQIISEVANDRVVLRLEQGQINVFGSWGSSNWYSSTFTQMDYPLEYQAPTRRKRDVDVSDMTFRELRDRLRQLEGLAASTPPVASAGSEVLREQMRRLRAARADLTAPVRIQMHRQVAFSFACIGFTLIGIPLAIRAHRRETSAGVAMALVLVMIYYAFVILGQALQSRAEWAPHLILWVPNFLFQAVGAVLLWRANRGM